MGLVDGQAFCGVPEHLGQGGNCRWGTKEVSYGFAGIMGQLGADAQKQLTRMAWNIVEAACGISLVETTDLSKANIVISAARGSRNQFDGPSGTLAWCELPCGNVSQVRLMFDLDETWAKDSAAGGIQYMLVCLHEGMHGLGLPHAPSGSSNVMAPIYNPRQTALGQWDIAELQKRYGPPSKPSPVPGVPVDQITIADLVLLNTKTGQQYALTPSTVSSAGLA